MFVPSTVAVPSTNGSSPTIARPIVVLPDPDSPTSPTTSPRPTVSVDVVDGAERRRPGPASGTRWRRRWRSTTRSLGAARRRGRARPARRSAVELVRARSPRGAARRRSSSLGVRVAAGAWKTCVDGPRLDDPAVLHHEHPVGQVGDDTHVVGDQQDAGVDAVLQVADQLEDLGLHRDVERGRRLVGDQQLRVQRQRLGDHRPLPLAARQLVRVGVDPPLGIGDLDQLEQLDRPLAGRLRRHRLVAAQHLGDLEPDGVHRVERGHRLLEDHRDLPAADLAAASGASIPTSSRPSSLIEPRTCEFFGSRPISDIAVVDLPEPDSPTMASTSPALQLERGVDHGRVPGAVDPEVDVEVASTSRTGGASRWCVDVRHEVPLRTAGCHDDARAPGVPAVVRPRADRRRRRRRRRARSSSLLVTEPATALRAAPWLALARRRVLGAVLAPGGRGRRRRRARSSTSLRTIDLPWPSIHAVDTKWALTLITAYGRFTAWAAPAPGRARRAARHQAGGAAPPGEHGVAPAAIRPGDLPSSPSGAAALMIRRRWEAAARRRLPRRPAAGARRGRR